MANAGLKFDGDDGDDSDDGDDGDDDDEILPTYINYKAGIGICILRTYSSLV